jgi:hypothetical protein
MDCRSISPDTWDHARRALIFYFSRRCPLADAEDHAQETIAAIWQRPDYQFETEDDFLKVCYGFARRIRFSMARDTRKHAGSVLDPNLPAADAAGGMRAIESSILLEEVRAMGERQLRNDDWGVIWRRATEMEPEGGVDARQANRMRVQLHRARQKLAAIAGWRQNKE